MASASALPPAAAAQLMLLNGALSPFMGPNAAASFLASNGNHANNPALAAVAAAAAAAAAQQQQHGNGPIFGANSNNRNSGVISPSATSLING